MEALLVREGNNIHTDLFLTINTDQYNHMHLTQLNTIKLQSKTYLVTAIN
jgi:hypothetical protein